MLGDPHPGTELLDHHVHSRNGTNGKLGHVPSSMRQALNGDPIASL